MSIFSTKDLSDLPPELIKELNLAGDVDTKILELFVHAGGVLNLSSLLIGYYRLHNETHKRKYMMSACYRLGKKGFLESTGKKGEYKITLKGKAILGREETEEVGVE